MEKEMATHFPVFLPGESHGQKSLVSLSPWGLKKSDMTEQLTLQHLAWVDQVRNPDSGDPSSEQQKHVFYGHKGWIEIGEDWKQE